MTDLAELRLVVDSSDFRKASGDLDKFQKEARETQGAADKVNKGMGSVAGSAALAARNLLGVVGVVAAARSGLQRAEAYTNLTNSLKALGQSGVEAEATIEKIAGVAQRSRAPIEATAQLYTRLSISAAEVGASQQDIIKFTELTTKALAASGTSAGQASGALLQLSQAMAGGVVRAEEFNSILEGAFPIAQAAADGIEEAAGSVGKLRQLVIDGKVSSEEFFEAILSQSDAIDQAFGSTSTTLSQAFTQLGNSITLLVGGLDGEAGLSGALASVVSDVAGFVDQIRALENLDTIATSLGAVGAAALSLVFPLSAVGVAAAAAATFLFRNWDSLRERFPGITGAIQSAASFIGAAFSSIMDAAGDFGTFFGVQAGLVLDAVDSIVQGDWSGAEAAARQLADNLVDALGGISDRVRDAVSGIGTIIGLQISTWYRRTELSIVTDLIAQNWQRNLETKILPVWDAAGAAASNEYVQAVVRVLTGQAALDAVRNALVGFWDLLSSPPEGWTPPESVIPDFSASALESIRNQGVALGTSLSEGFTEGVQSSGEGVGTAARGLGAGAEQALRDYLESNSPSRLFMRIGGFAGEGFALGIKEGAGPAGNAAAEMSQNAAVIAANVAIQDFRSVGGAAADGIVLGMREHATEVAEGAAQLARVAKEAAEKELGVASPSRVFAEIGGHTVDGFVRGVLSGADDAKKAIEEVAGGAVDAGSRLADGVADTFAGLFTGAYESAEDALSAIKNLFLDTLKDMIAQAIRNPIRMIFQGGGAQGPGLAGAGQGLFGGFSQGLQSVIGGFSQGGFGGAFGAIGTALKGIGGGGLAGIGTALGAVAPVVGVVAAAISFFQTKTKELDRGLRITIGEVDTLVESFRKVEKSRFWGLSKSTKTTYDRLGEAAAAPIISAVDTMQKGIIDMAESVGVAAEAFDGFTYRVRISTRDRDAQEAVAAALKGAADAMAELAFAGTEGAEDLMAVMQVEKQLADVRAASARAVAASGLTNPIQGAGNIEATRTPEYRAFKSAMDEVTKDFDEQIRSLNAQLSSLRNTQSIYIRDGETASEALERLSVALTTVNAQFDFMQRELFDVSIASADLASQLVDLFGGAEAFATATTRYIDLFYSEAERAALITDALTKELAAFNVALPSSRNALRGMVDGLDLTTERGRELYAVLVQNADAFDTILPRVASLSMILQEAFEFAAPLLDDAVRQSQESAREFQRSGQLWERTAGTIRDFIADLRGTDLGGASAASQLEFNRSAFEAATAAARAGDQAAAAQIPELGRAFLASARETAQSTEQFRAIANRVAAESQLVAGVASLEGAIDNVIADLFEQNVAALTDLAEAVASGADVDKALEEFGPKVDDLAAAIEGLQELSYEGIRDALDSITVDIRSRDDIPRYLREIITGEAGNLVKTLDFVIRRDDLTPEQLFVAANTISSLTKSIAFVVNDTGLSNKVIDLALTTSGQIRRGLIFQIERPLAEPLQTFALTAYDTLARGVLLTLDSDSDNVAKRLALEGIGDYVATVRATMAPDSEVSDRVRRIVYRQAGTYTAAIGAVINSEDLSRASKRILLRQTGDYIAKIRGIVEDPNERRRDLLLRENTKGLRRIILAPEYRDGLGAWTDFIRGGSDGKVQLGGTISFDPTKAFENTLAKGILEPFELAAEAMAALQAALAKDAELQREANQLQRLGNLREAQANILTEAQGIFDSIRALEEKFGIRVVESQSGKAARFGITEDGLFNVSRDRSLEISSAMSQDFVDQFRDAYRPLVARLEELFGVPAALNRQIDRLSEGLGIPGFATGGSHRGGLRIVGERGPELEATGPSRIYSNAQMREMMNGDPRVVAELRAMRREQKIIGDKIETNTRRLRAIEEGRERVAAAT